MTFLKIIASFLLLVFVISWAFYSWLLGGVWLLVEWSNQGFIAYLPSEAKAIILLLVFGLLTGLAYALFRE
jgi:hypothetical protein